MFWQGGMIEAAQRALDYGRRDLRLAKIYAGHPPGNRLSQRILEKLGFAFLDKVLYEPMGLLHPS
jgi:[ribosomal protein S5]-alanine N-acetyltransferase